MLNIGRTFLPVPMSLIPIESDNRIIGGAPAQSTSHPHQVSIQRRSGIWYYSCRGSIVTVKVKKLCQICVDDKRTKRYGAFLAYII